MSSRKKTFLSILWIMGLVEAGMALLYAAVTHA